MKAIIIFLNLFIIIHVLSGQSVYLETRAIYDFNFIDHNRRINFNNIGLTDGYVMGYEQTINNYNYSVDYMNNYNWVFSPLINDTFDTSFGNTITRSHIITIGINRSYKLYKKLSFGWSGMIRGVWVKRLFQDNDNCQLMQKSQLTYQACNNLRAFPGLKIEPSMNGFLDFAFIEQVHLYFKFVVTKGFSKYQEIQVKYRYKGVDQPSVTSYSNGTGFYLGFGLKYDIVKK